MPISEKTQINLFISMLITIMTSIKLYLSITNNLNREIELSRDFYILAIDIFKHLNLTNNRPNANDYLNDCYSNYIKLTEKSNLLNKLKGDELIKLDDNDNESVKSHNSFNIINKQQDEF